MLQKCLVIDQTLGLGTKKVFCHCQKSRSVSRVSVWPCFPPFQQPFLRRKGNKKAPPLKSTSGVQIVFALPFPPSQIDRWRLSITLDSARNIIGGQGVVAKRKEGESGGDSTGKKEKIDCTSVSPLF